MIATGTQCLADAGGKKQQIGHVKNGLAILQQLDAWQQPSRVKEPATTFPASSPRNVHVMKSSGFVNKAFLGGTRLGTSEELEG